MVENSLFPSGCCLFSKLRKRRCFRGEQWGAVLAAALLVHQLVPQQKKRTNITLYNFKSDWKDLAST